MHRYCLHVSENVEEKPIGQLLKEASEFGQSHAGAARVTPRLHFVLEQDQQPNSQNLARRTGSPSWGYCLSKNSDSAPGQLAVVVYNEC